MTPSPSKQGDGTPTDEPAWACYCAHQPECCFIEGACCYACQNEKDERDASHDEWENDDA